MPRSGFETCARVVCATAGSYFAASSSFMIFCILLVHLGMRQVEAVTLGMILVFVLYLCFILWVFASSTLWRPAGLFAFLIMAGYGPVLFRGYGH